MTQTSANALTPAAAPGPAAASLEWFAAARFGLFIHYGLYSLLGRGEWVMNRERIPIPEYRKLADRFTAERFDAEALCDLAVNSGMRYVVLTTMHHDGFRLYDTDLTDFNTVKTAARRDLVAELLAAARKRKLRVGLYHSLNNWRDQPDSVAALESQADYETFIAATFARLRELNQKYKPFDVMWYDGWWPFNAQQWRAQAMNAMVRQLQPNVLINGRNCLPGDFATPEQHMSAPTPWRPWEGCVTLNHSWGFHAADHAWKSPLEVVRLLATAAAGVGNLLLNIGPHGDGSVPQPSLDILKTVGDWLRRGGDQAIYDTQRFTFNSLEHGPRHGPHRGDWSTHGPTTARGNDLYLLAPRWPGRELVLSGLSPKLLHATLLNPGHGKPADPIDVRFEQAVDRVRLTGLPEASPDPVCPVIRLRFDGTPSMYLTGGMRVPNVPHPHYDPAHSDLAGTDPG